MSVLKQHPSQWPDSCQLQDRESALPELPGIYAVVDKGVHYIGKSVNLKKRWQGDNHHRYEQADRALNNPSLHWFTCSKAQLDQIERPLIKYWKTQGEAQWNDSKVIEYSDTSWLDFLWGIPGWAWWGAAAIVLFWLLEEPPKPQRAATPVYSSSGDVIDHIPSDATVTPKQCDSTGSWVEIDWDGRVRGWVDVKEFDGVNVCGEFF